MFKKKFYVTSCFPQNFITEILRNVCIVRSIPPDVLMSPPVFPESSGFMPNSLSNKITMENGNTDNEEKKEEGEIFSINYPIRTSR